MPVPRITTEQTDQGLWVVALEGEHDLSTCDGLRRELDLIFELSTCLVIDLSVTTFIDSSILGELVSRHRRAADQTGDRFAVVAPPGSAADRLFRLTAADEILTVLPSRAAAVEWCRTTEAAEA